MSDEPTRRTRRAVSPVVGVTLFVFVVLLLAVVVGAMAVGLSESGLRSAESVDLHDDSQCPGFQDVEYEPPNFEEVHDVLEESNCALWLDAGDLETDGNEVVAWRDSGRNDFDARQADGDHRPRVVHSGELDADVVDFQGGAGEEGATDGDYLRLERDVSEMALDEDSGLVVVSVLRVQSFNRGGVWTIGEAGVDGREYSMRTCSNFAVDGCHHADPSGHWRAQHWGSADVDFSADATHHRWAVLVHAYDGDEVTVRVNGETVATRSVDLDLSGNRDVQLGRWERTAGDPHWYFHGRMAELLIFDRSLDDEEVETVEEYLEAKFDLE